MFQRDRFLLRIASLAAALVLGVLLWLLWPPTAPVLPVRFIVQPFFAHREHVVSVDLGMLNEPCFRSLTQAWEATFYTTLLPNGEHQLKMEPFRLPGLLERLVQSLRPPYEHMLPLPVETWTVFVTNSSVKTKEMPPASEPARRTYPWP